MSLNLVTFEVFDRILRETAAWCDVMAPFTNLQTGLRTPSMAPRLPDGPGLEAISSAIEELAAHRHRLLLDVKHGTLDGRVLACEFNNSVWCGACDAATGGFFDIDDRPPWETWVCAFNVEFSSEPTSVVLSWVPRKLVQVVEQGINVNPVCSVYWLRDAPAQVREHPLAIRALELTGLS